VKVKAVTDESAAGWDTKRFLVTFALNDLDRVMKEDFWPSGIYFKKFFPARPTMKKLTPNNDGPRA